jgi:hypothetical protein
LFDLCEFALCDPFLEQKPHINKEIAIIYKHSVHTSQHTLYFFITRMNHLMLLRETIAVCFQSHVKHSNTLCGKNAVLVC